MSISFPLAISVPPNRALAPWAWREVAMFYKLFPDNIAAELKTPVCLRQGGASCVHHLCGLWGGKATCPTDLWDRSSAQAHITVSDWPCSLGPLWSTAGDQSHKHLTGGRDLKPISHCHSVPRAVSGSPGWQDCGASRENVSSVLEHTEEPKVLLYP